VGVKIGEHESKVDLIPLESNNFDIILGMDWLSKHKAQIECYTKTVTFQGLWGRRMIFRGERTIILTNLISAVSNRKLLRKGCTRYLAYVLNSKNDETGLNDILIVKEFPNVFLKELPGLPPDREVKVSINTFLEVPPDSTTTIQNGFDRTKGIKNLAARVTG